MELNFIEPPSIGEILREEFMEPMNLSAYSEMAVSGAGITSS